MSQVTVTTTTSTPPVTVVCSRTMLIKTTATLAPCGPDNFRLVGCGSTTIVDSWAHNEAFCWPHHYTAATTTSVPDAFWYMPTMPLVICKYVSLLVSSILFAFCFQAPMWLACSPIGAQPLGFATLQLF